MGVTTSIATGLHGDRQREAPPFAEMEMHMGVLRGLVIGSTLSSSRAGAGQRDGQREGPVLLGRVRPIGC